MLARALGIDCSKRCESFIAMALILSPEKVISLAEQVVQDRSQAAIKLAEAALSISQMEAKHLASLTLRQFGIFLEDRQSCQRKF